MKIMIKNIILLFAIFCGYAVQAQFNTLTRSSINNSKETEKILVNTTHNGNVATHKYKRKPSKQEILNRLQREMDSLKMAMHLEAYEDKDREHSDIRKLKDSIITLFKNAVTNDNSAGIRHEKRDFLPQQMDTKLKTKFYLPLENRLHVSSKFGNRHHPIFQTAKMHNGTDLKAVYENVITVLDGFVIQSGWDSKGGGYYMKIKHSNAFVISYLHLSERYFKVGDFVKAGNIIAKSGNSGNSTGPHLHFSVQENGKYINPMSFLYDLNKAKNLIATYYEK